jgi:hypothetical protein
MDRELLDEMRGLSYQLFTPVRGISKPSVAILLWQVANLVSGQTLGPSFGHMVGRL